MAIPRFMHYRRALCLRSLFLSQKQEQLQSTHFNFTSPSPYYSGRRVPLSACASEIQTSLGTKTRQNQELCALSCASKDSGGCLDDDDGHRADHGSDLRVKQLTLVSLGFTEDGVEVEDHGSTQRRKRGWGSRNRSRIVPINIEEKDGEEEEEHRRSCPTPEEMKQAALDASNILAQVAGVKIKAPDSKTVARQSHSNAINRPQNYHMSTPRQNAPTMMSAAHAPVAEEELDGGSFQETGLNRHHESDFEHPWSEWVEFLHYLLANKFFAGMEEWAEEGKSLLETYSCVRHACVAFSLARGDIFRFLSKKDLSVLAKYGCPDMEKKGSNASKRLRAYLIIPEGEVCQRCRLKMSCERAFLDPPMQTSPSPRTLDVVRIIIRFAVNAPPSAESHVSYPADVSTSVCRLLREILTFSSAPRDPYFVDDTKLIQKLSSKLKQDKPVARKSFECFENPGDWHCPNCEFLNFAKNTKCRECQVLRPRLEQDELLTDWQCSKCRYVNFQKNKLCRECRATRDEAGDADEAPKQLLGKAEGNHGDFGESRAKCYQEEGLIHTKSRASSSLEKDDAKEDLYRRRNKIDACDIARKAVKRWSRHAENRDSIDGASARHGSLKCVEKLTMSKKGAALEEDYEASEEDAAGSADVESDDLLEVIHSESDIDLSAEEDEALSHSSPKPLRTKASKVSFRWSGDEDCKGYSPPHSGNVTRHTVKTFDSSDISRSKDAKPSYSRNPTANFSQLVSQSSTITSQKVDKLAAQKGSNALFDWSDSDTDESHTQSRNKFGK